MIYITIGGRKRGEGACYLTHLVGLIVLKHVDKEAQAVIHKRSSFFNRLVLYNA